VEAGALLLQVREIEGCAWPDVVNVPATIALILPRHPWLELSFEMGSEFFNGAAEQLQGSGGFGEALEGFAEAIAEVTNELEGVVGPAAIAHVSPLPLLIFRALLVSPEPLLIFRALLVSPLPLFVFRPLPVCSESLPDSRALHIRAPVVADIGACTYFAQTPTAELTLLIQVKLLQPLLHPTF